MIPEPPATDRPVPDESSSERVSVRPARGEDVAAIADLHVRAWRVAYQGMLPDDHLAGLSAEARASRWRELLDAGVRVLVAERRSSLAGFVAHGPSRDDDAPPQVGEIYALYVHPDAWGQAVGWTLHDAALADLTALELTRATLWVLDTNIRARRFYARQGWRPDGVARVEDLAGLLLNEARYRRTLEQR